MFTDCQHLLKNMCTYTKNIIVNICLRILDKGSPSLVNCYRQTIFLLLTNTWVQGHNSSAVDTFQHKQKQAQIHLSAFSDTHTHTHTHPHPHTHTHKSGQVVLTAERHQLLGCFALTSRWCSIRIVTSKHNLTLNHTHCRLQGSS